MTLLAQQGREVFLTPLRASRVTLSMLAVGQGVCPE